MTLAFFRKVSRVLLLAVIVTVTLAIAFKAFASSRGTSKLVAIPSVNVPPASLSPVCPTSFTVNNNGDAADAAPGDESCATAGAVCTLRAAIEEANALPACGVIDINFSGVPSPISLATALPALNHNVNIIGTGANLLKVQRSTAGGTPNFRVFHISSGRTVTISGLTIANGNLITFGQNGGGVLNNGTLTLTNCNVFGNSAGVFQGFGTGGGIYHEGTSLVVNNSNIGGIGSDQANTGGVFSNGPLTMNGGSIVGNLGIGIVIATGTTTTLNGVAITNNTENSNGGAGVLIIGTANIYNSLIANNTALGGSGGGIRNGGTLTAVNSTVSSNGAIGSGGGIYNFNATTSLVNVTITNNRADTNDNGAGGDASGGIHPAGGTVLLKNTIVAGNFRGPGSTADDVTSPVSAASSFNLIGACNGCGLSDGVNNNQVNVANAYLSALANNGGPTLSHALNFGSPAIDAAGVVTVLNGDIDSSTTTINVADASAFPTAIGFVIQIDDEQMIVTGKVSNTLTVSRGANSTAAAAHTNMAAVNPAFDQRGNPFSRRLNAGIDIGAYEFSKLEVNSLADTTDGACTDVGIGNGCTFREAITAANTRSGAESITFAPALTSGGAALIILLTALPELSSEISIFGPGANRLTVARSSAGGIPNFRILTVQGGGTVAIYDLTLASGWQPNSVGGNIFNNGILSLTNCMVNGGSTGFGVGTGGGIFNNSGAILTLNNTSMTLNSANGGGAILNAGTLTLIDSKLFSNVSNTGGGGGIYNNGTVTLTNSTISGNFAQSGGAGAGIFNSGTVTLRNSTVSGNLASNGAGGLFNGGNLSLTNCTVSGNSSANIAGGIYSGAGTTTLVNTTVTNNRSDSNNSGAETGGGIYRNNGTVTLNNTIVAGNFRGTGSTRDDINGAIDVASSNNLIGDGTGLTGISDGTNGNLVGSSGSPINPMLGTLANNGGLTLTHALISGSPAIDAGNNAAVTNPPFIGPPFTDQRGGTFNRIADGDVNGTVIVDIGAYELQGPLTIDNVNPKAGRTSGGQQIQLTGAFANLSTVTMGGTSATWSYTNGAADTSMITVTSPAHAVGAVEIVLTPTSGSSHSKPNAFAYLPTVFTEDTLVVGQTTAKAQHIIELRQAVDALRAVAGLSAATWTDPTLSPTSTIIKAVHIVELRSYLDSVATQLGYSISPYTDASLGAGLVIKRIHIEELRQRIRTIAG